MSPSAFVGVWLSSPSNMDFLIYIWKSAHSSCPNLSIFWARAASFICLKELKCFCRSCQKYVIFIIAVSNSNRATNRAWVVFRQAFYIWILFGNNWEYKESWWGFTFYRFKLWFNWRAPQILQEVLAL